MEELRAAVVSGKSQVVLTDVEAMVLALGHIGRSLASLRGDCVTLWGFLSLSLSLRHSFRKQPNGEDACRHRPN